MSLPVFGALGSERQSHPKRTHAVLQAEQRIADANYVLPPRTHEADRGLLIAALDVCYEAVKHRTDIPSGASTTDFVDAVEHAVIAVDGTGANGTNPVLYEVTVLYAMNVLLFQDELFDRLRQLDVMRVTNMLVTGKYATRRLVLQFHVYSVVYPPPRLEVQRQLITIIFKADENTAAPTSPSERRIVHAANAPRMNHAASDSPGVLHSVSSLVSRFMS